MLHLLGRLAERREARAEGRLPADGAADEAEAASLPLLLALAPHCAPLVRRCLAAGPPPLALALRAASGDAAWRFARAALRLAECGGGGGMLGDALQALRHDDARVRWAAAALTARELGVSALPTLLRRCCSAEHELDAVMGWEEESAAVAAERAAWLYQARSRLRRRGAARRLFVKQQPSRQLRPVAARRPH